MNEGEKSFLIDILIVVLAIVAVIIYALVSAKSSFECRFKSPDGKCALANCPRDEYWSAGSQKCEKWGSSISNRSFPSASDYGSMWDTKNSHYNLPYEELERIAKYGPKMFNNLPAGVSPPKTY